ncbi:MAG: polysaccharide biosynthesis protein [Thermotoga sp. 4484_232]|nr:MAG: polysaccharide biosynthesis protein [Thermotoga sp. 4484_232]RKX41460.1 MAG: polysaccharide biosynthesis protein [Thermotogota bacterium]RKX57143.1 MAG: polysaccharide biosynthesis protein [Thermotoga sp.]
MIPLSKPDINGEDVKVVVEVLKSGRLSMGPYTEKFEKAVSEYVNAKYGVAVSSGTAGLHLVLKAMGVKRGDYMIVPSFTFVASANVALYEGAIPLFVDVEEETLNASKDSLEDLLIRIKKGKVKILNEVVDPSRVKYFMGVDIFGHPLDWDEILEVTNEWRLEVLEDSCEALGAEYKGKRVGKFGVAGVFAFYPNKQITTGEGGVVITDDERIAKLVRSMRNQGRGEENEWLLHVRLGYNYRIDEMSAALGYSQMLRIDEILEKRKKVAENYNELLKDYEWVKIPSVKEYVTRMSWFVYVIRLSADVNRDKVMKYMEGKGVQVRNYFQPLHLQPFYRETFGYGEGMLPITEEESKKTLALPFYNDLSLDEQKVVVETLREAVERVG